MHNTEYNPIRIIGIIIIAGLFIWYFPITHNLLFPAPKTIETTKLIYINNTKTVFVTPTPDGRIYFASEYQSGIRKLNQPYSFISYKASDGISKNNSFKFSVNVYDYRQFDYLHWYNPSLGKYQILFPKTGYKFLFVFVDAYIDDILSDNIRIWLPNNFQFQYLTDVFTEYADNETKQLRYRELEFTPNINNDGYIQYYGQKRMYVNTEDTRKTAGEYSEQQYYLYEGFSNRMNGYILYEIPDYINIQNGYIIANFGGFGYSSWSLQN